MTKYKKCVKVIESCITVEQLSSANQYLKLYLFDQPNIFFPYLSEDVQSRWYRKMMEFSCAP